MMNQKKGRNRNNRDKEIYTHTCVYVCVTKIKDLVKFLQYP